jgi:hypothetical protein
MENLEWKDKIDKESDIEAKDVNSLANAIITIIDWINSNGDNGDIDLSDYVKKEQGKGLSTVSDIIVGIYDNAFGEGEITEIELRSATGDILKDKYITLYNQEQMDEKLSQKATMSDVEAYIEETLLGGAW